MDKNSKKERKQICINLPIEIYEQLEKNAEKRGLSKTSYIEYVTQNDRDDLYSKKASNALNRITCSAEKLLDSVDENDKIRPFVVEISDGVKELWRYLR